MAHRAGKSVSVKERMYHIRAEVWLYPSEVAAWHFLSVGRQTSADIRERHGKNIRGFGSLPVVVTIGKTTWQTSIFPDKRSGTYILPLKNMVRQKEGIREGDRVSVTLQMRSL